MPKRKDIYNIIIRPLVTEKAIAGAETDGAYTFKVDPRVNKVEIKRAIEGLFNVKVKSVRTANMKGKPGLALRGGRRHAFRRPGWKKAVVKLAGDDRIDIV